MTIVSETEKHYKFLGKPLARLNEISNLIPKDQLILLEQYGAWMEALVRNEIEPLTEDQKKFIQVARKLGTVSSFGEKCGRTSFEKAWINSIIVRSRNQIKVIPKVCEQPIQIKKVSDFSNPDPIQNVISKSEGGLGFITGIVLAVLAFSIVPVIPVILAFFAGHWVSNNLGKN